jgi:hypothetical protein
MVLACVFLVTLTLAFVESFFIGVVLEVAEFGASVLVFTVFISGALVVVTTELGLGRLAKLTVT